MMIIPPRSATRLFFLFLLGWLISGALPHIAAAADIPADQAGFTDYVARAITKALPDTRVSKPAPLYLDVASPTGAKSTAYLQSLYAQCQRIPENCDRIIATWVDQMSASFAHKETPIDRSTLRIVLRPSGYVEQLREMQKQEPVAAPFIAGLWMICVADAPTTMSYPKADSLAALGLSRSDALALCQKNTAAALHPIMEVARAFPPGLIGLLADDPYESSRLLWPDSWKPVLGPRGKLIASAPGSDVLLFTPASGKAAVEALAERTREVAQKVSKPISLSIFRWTPTGFKEILPQ